MISGYNAVKDYSPLAKASLEKAEAAGQRVFAVAAPVISSLNDMYKLDDKGVAVLEKGEHAVQEVKSAATEVKNRVTGVAIEGKDLAQNLIESHPTRFNQVLDLTENLVNTILPPEEKPEKEAHKNDDHGVIARATTLGSQVAARAKAKLRTIPIRSPQQLAELTHAVDLIQYAAKFIDIDVEKARLDNAADLSKAAVYSAIQNTKAVAEQAMEKAQPVKKFLEEKTGQIQNSAQRQIVAVVASIAHATEVLRRQIGARAANVDVHGTRVELQRRLAEII
jgi:hypothetical protein